MGRRIRRQINLLATVQRVSKAEVLVRDNIYSSKKNGLLIFLCIEQDDTQQTIKDMVNKL